MHASTRLISAAVAIFGLSQGFFEGSPLAADPEAVGTFTAVQGQVQMTRPGVAQPVSVKLSDAVVYKALIETQEASRAKALFLDDSMLTVAENSKVQVNEQIYDPKHGKRSLVFNLLEGKVRALVTKVFQGSGSRFEIRTPTAVAAARGTYFVVWIERGGSEHETPTGVASQNVVAAGESAPHMLPYREFTGVANIGDSGNVDFTSNGQTVTVKPGHYTVAVPGQPPTPPAPLSKSIPTQVSQAIRATSVVNAPKPETPHEMLRATAGAAPMLPATTSGTGVAEQMNAYGKSGSMPNGGPNGVANGQGYGGNAAAAALPSTPATPIGITGPSTTVVVTPPAAVTGAINSSNAPGKIPAFVNPPTPGYLSNGRGGGGPNH